MFYSNPLIGQISISISSAVGSAPAWLTLIQNCGKKTCEMIIIFDSVQERSNWIELIAPTQVKFEMNNKVILHTHANLNF